MSAPSVIVKTLPSQLTNSGVSAHASERHRWSPYNVNEGTCLAVSGPDYVVVAGDTRMSDGYSILSRDVSKLHQLTSLCVLGSAGMQADAVTLRKVLDIRVQQYRFRQNEEISTQSIAQLLSNTLYYKRFFPYYTFNILGGLDSEGRGAVYGYDAIGSFERMPYGVTGSASALITSILDNQVAFKTQKQNERVLSLEETLDLVKDVFTCAGERDIYTGDAVQIAVITKDGVKWEKFELKKD